MEFLRGCFTTGLEVSIFQKNVWVVPQSADNGG